MTGRYQGRSNNAITVSTHTISELTSSGPLNYGRRNRRPVSFVEIKNTGSVTVYLRWDTSLQATALQHAYPLEPGEIKGYGGFGRRPEDLRAVKASGSDDGEIVVSAEFL